MQFVENRVNKKLRQQQQIWRKMEKKGKTKKQDMTEWMTHAVEKLDQSRVFKKHFLCPAATFLGYLLHAGFFCIIFRQKLTSEALSNELFAKTKLVKIHPQVTKKL